MIAALYVETGGAYFNLPGVDLPELRWGRTEARLDPEVVARIGLAKAKRRGEVAASGGGTDSTPRIHTPAEFRDLLINMARSAEKHRTAA